MKREAAILPKPLLAAARPIRIQRSRKEKQVSPNGLPIVYVGRPTKFGNPFKVGEEVGCLLSVLDRNDFLFYHEGRIIDSNDEAVELFEKYLLKFTFSDFIKQELKGKNLSCWCRVTDICHADTLLKIANS